MAAPPGATFDDAELRFLETVGRQLCLAVEGARHLKAERLYNQEARALAALNKGIGESLDPEAVLAAVGRTALEVLHVDRVHILLGSDPRALSVAHLAGLPHPELRKGQVLDLTAMGDSLHRRALEQQVRLETEDWAHDERVNKEIARRWAGAAALILPLVARKATLGLLVLTSGAPHHWTEDQVDVAEALASQASVALENARLYDKARRAYRELNEAQARIIQSEKMAVVGTFASGLAHEVRNPLNSIALQLSILERRVAPLPAGVAGEIKELVGVIREEVKRLDNLVGDFLQFSRSNRVQYRPASLDALVDEVARLLRPEARAAGVTLRRQRIGDADPRPARGPREDEAGRDQPGAERHRGDAGRRGGDGRERPRGRARGAGRPRLRARACPRAWTSSSSSSRPRPGAPASASASHSRSCSSTAARSPPRASPGKGATLHGEPSGRAAGRGRGRRSMSVKGRIVVIDDEVNAAAALETLLAEDGYDVARANDARARAAAAREARPRRRPHRPAHAGHGRHRAARQDQGDAARRPWSS